MKIECVRDIECTRVYTSFYRATRMHSADCAVARCPSVRLSVRHTPVFCQNGYTYPQTFFLYRRIAMTILVVPYTKRNGNTPTETPNGGVEYKGGIKKITIGSFITIAKAVLLHCSNDNRRRNIATS